MRPKREHVTNYGQTYMITAETWGRRALFRAELWARLFIDTLYHYRGSAYLLHEFVIMPDHVHLLITPLTSLEKAVQFIKGGFSYRAKKELGSNMEVWQTGFSDHRIRDEEDYVRHVEYIRQNPVRKQLAATAGEYAFSSASAGFELDKIPPGLKPPSFSGSCGAPEGAPLQNNAKMDKFSESASLQNKSRALTLPEGAPLQNNFKMDKFSENVRLQNKSSALILPEGAPLQNKAEADKFSESAPLQNDPDPANNTSVGTMTKSNAA